MVTRTSLNGPRQVVLINDTRADAHHGCWRVMRTLEALLAERGFEVSARAPAHTDWRTNAAVKAAIPKASLVLVNGEGTLHHDAPAGGPLLAVAALAGGCGVPSVLVNASWQDNGPNYQAGLKLFSLVQARERGSQAEMASAGVEARLAPDLSLYDEVVPAGPRAGVGFTDSVVRSRALALEKARRRLGGSAAPIMYHPPGIGGTLRNLREGIARRDLADPGFLLGMLSARAASRGAELRDEAAYMAKMTGLELLVTGRFHAATFAMAAGTPVLAVDSNTRKIAATFADAGLEPWRVVEADTLDADMLERGRRWTEGERRNLADYLAAGRLATRRLYDEIAEIAR